MGTGAGAVEVALLGPLEARVGGVPVHLGGPKPRAVLAMVALRPGTVVSVDELLTGVWGHDAADGAQASLQVHVSNLRKAVGAATILTRSPGYVLAVDGSAVDHVAAESDLREARSHRTAGRLEVAAELIEGCLRRWRGVPLADLGDVPFAAAAGTWFEERRLVAVEDLVEVELARGEHRVVVGRLEDELARTPFREALWGQLMVALYRAGRQADALAAFQRARRSLGDGLGVEPGRPLRDIEAAVLAQSPSLDVPTAPIPTGRAPMTDTTTVPAWAGGDRRLERDGVAVPVDGIVVIGRAETATITLGGTAVSRRHAELRPTVAGDLLVDLGSTNGTLVNGEPVTTRVLQDGDEVQVGDHLLRYRTI